MLRLSSTLRLADSFLRHTTLRTGSTRGSMWRKWTKFRLGRVITSRWCSFLFVEVRLKGNQNERTKKRTARSIKDLCPEWFSFLFCFMFSSFYCSPFWILSLFPFFSTFFNLPFPSWIRLRRDKRWCWLRWQIVWKRVRKRHQIKTSYVPRFFTTDNSGMQYAIVYYRAKIICFWKLL